MSRRQELLRELEVEDRKLAVEIGKRLVEVFCQDPQIDYIWIGKRGDPLHFLIDCRGRTLEVEFAIRRKFRDVVAELSPEDLGVGTLSVRETGTGPDYEEMGLVFTRRVHPASR